MLSLRSNLENHPARIVEPQKRAGGVGGGTIKLSNKTGMPAAYGSSGVTPMVVGSSDVAGVVSQAGVSDGSGGSDDSDGGHLDDDDDGTGIVLLERRKDETPEEKRARKAAVKEAKREARASKKALKTMFKEEGTKQRKQAAGRSSGAPAGGSTFVIA